MHKFSYKLTLLNFLTCASLHMIEKSYLNILRKGGKLVSCLLIIEYLYFNENLIDNKVRNIAGCVHMGINYKILGTK
jgi:hypothetical protein